MESLPNTTIAEIISYLPFKDKASVRLINSRWNRSAEVVLRKVNFLFVHGLFPYESPCEKDSLRFTPYMEGRKESLLCTRAKLPTLLVNFIRKYCPHLSVLITTLSISWDDLITISSRLQFFACCAIIDTPSQMPIDFRQVFTQLRDFIIFKKIQSLLCPTRMIQAGVPLVTLESSLHSLTCEHCRSISYYSAIFGTQTSVNPQVNSTIDKLSSQLRHIRCFTNEAFGSSSGFHLPNLESLFIYFWITGLPRYLANSSNLKQLVVSPSGMSVSDAKQFVLCLKNLKQLRYLEMFVRDGQVFDAEESVVLPLGQTYLTKFKYHSGTFSCFLVANTSFHGSEIKISLNDASPNNNNNNNNNVPVNAGNNAASGLVKSWPLSDFAHSSLKQMDLKFETKVDWSHLISRLATVRGLQLLSVCFKDLTRMPSPSQLPSMLHMTELSELHIISTNRAIILPHSSRVRPFKMISLPPNVQSFTWSMPHADIASLLSPTFATSLRVLVLSVTSQIDFKLWFPCLNELYLTITQCCSLQRACFSLECITNLSELTHLYINYCFSEYVDKISNLISSFPKLKKLALTETPNLYADNGVSPTILSSHSSLHRLTTQIVTKCPSLQTLITNAPLTDDCFLMLSSARNLSHLQVKMTQEQMVIFFSHLPMNRIEKNILIANQRFITLPATVSKIFTMQTYSITLRFADMQSHLHDTLLFAILSKKISKYSFVPDLRCTCLNNNCLLKVK